MQSFHTLYYLLASFLLFSVCMSDEVDFDGWLNIKLEHSFSSSAKPEYTNRGNITIHGGSSTVHNAPLSNSDRVKLQSLAAEDKFYRLRAIVINNDGSETTFLTYIKACMLAQTGLHDQLSIALDYAGNVIAVSLGVHSSVGCQGYKVSLDELVKFSTKVYVYPSISGPTPDTTSYIQKLEREREAKERGDVKDNRSFLAKYWMYIVPVVIIMVISSAANPDGAGGGGRG